MGLTSWKNAPDGPIRKADVTVAKNYLTQEELTDLNRIVTMYLDFAEDQARRRQPMTMVEWVQRLDAFLAFNDRSVLTDVGRVSHALAEARAEEELARFRSTHVETSDFDEVVARTRGLTRRDPL